MEDSLLDVVRLDEVAMKYRVSCEICGSQIALIFGGLEVRIIEEGGSYVALIQLPLPGDYLDSYLLEEYSRRHCLFLHLVGRGVLRDLSYELRAEIPSVVAKSTIGNLGRAAEFIEKIAKTYEEVAEFCSGK
ncbi:MAG: hypothetical protein RMI56_03175 [Sulfolobales archaeon]|nr:hypothetical protein [Sulfolobales archaeon]